MDVRFGLIKIQTAHIAPSVRFIFALRHQRKLGLMQAIGSSFIKVGRA